MNIMRNNDVHLENATINEFNIPEDWELEALGDLATLSRGVSWKKEEENPSGIAVVSIPNIVGDKVKFNIKYKIDKRIPENKKLGYGDVLLVTSSGSIHNVGRSAIVKDMPYDEVSFASFLAKIRTKHENLLQDYLYYLTKSNLLNFAAYSKRAADGKFNLQVKQLGNQCIPLPPSEEQRAIAHVLSTIQHAIEATDQVIAAARELKKSLMEHLFTYGPVPIDEVDDVPLKETLNGSFREDWDVEPLGNICSFKGGTQPPKSQFANRPEAGYVRLLQIRDFTSDSYATYVPFTENLRLVSEQDVLIARYGASVGKILKGLEGAINVALVKTIPDEELVAKNYLYYYFQASCFQKFLKSLGGRSAQAGFNKGELKNLSVPIPSIREQTEIVKHLSILDEKIQSEQERWASLGQLFSSLLHHLMTGKVRVKDLDLGQTEVAQE